MKPGYTIMVYEFINITNANNGAIFKAHVAIKKNVGNMWTYIK